MKHEMTHEEAFIALDAVALDGLDALERDAVLAHAEGCPICRVELSQLRDTAAHLAFTSPLSADTATQSRARIHTRLMARAAADEGVQTVIVPPRSLINAIAWRRAEWMAAAASVLLVVSVSLLAMSYRERQAMKDQLAYYNGRGVTTMMLMSTSTKAPVGQMFWDKSRDMWTLVAHSMPDPKPGRTYQLWLVTPTSKISAGTFMPKSGDVMMQAKYALAADQLMAVAVTDEPMGGMPQPTGDMVMSATTH
jgi:hypothetical protein